MNIKKLKLFFQGRKGLLPRIEAACARERNIIWFHVASYGEFEEARPVIEATRKRFPGRKILLTVFSPSVYEPMKHYDQVDWVLGRFPLGERADMIAAFDRASRAAAALVTHDVQEVMNVYNVQVPQGTAH